MNYCKIGSRALLLLVGILCIWTPYDRHQWLKKWKAGTL